MRKIFITLLISSLLAVPIIGQLNFNVYAESSSTVTREEAKEAFRAYCISRNLLIDGSALGSAAAWLGNGFDNAITTLGIDMDYLQTQLSKVYSGAGFKWAFTASGIALYNRIFAELLQREDLEVGDEDVEKIVYSGKTFTDVNGNSCLLYVINDLSTYQERTGRVLQWGTPYCYSGELLNINKPSTVTLNLLNGLTYTANIYYSGYQFTNPVSVGREANSTERPYVIDGILFANQSYQRSFKGSFIIATNIDGSKIELCTFNQVSVGTNIVYGDNTCLGELLDLTNRINPDDTDVTVYTPDGQPIKPEFPEDEPVDINPDGTTGDNPVNPDDPDNPNNPIIPPDDPDAPTGGTPPDWSTDTEVEPDGDGWKIPFTLPDLDIDWSIDGLGSKFPFCIPRDLVALVGVLNVEPTAPHFTGTVDLLLYDWQVNIDFEQFDTIGVIVRNGLFILFCIGLLVATRAIIRG